MTIKIARNHYGSFEHVGLGLRFNKDDTFVVTPEFEQSKAFKTGLERKKFEILEITDIRDVQNAHGSTDEMVEAVRDILTAEPEEPEPESEPKVTEDAPDIPMCTNDPGCGKPQDECICTPEQPADAETDKIVEDALDSTSSDIGTDGDAVITPPAPPEEEEPTIAFTEIAGNVDNALKAIAKETDIEKLKFALREDERKSVKTAIVARLKELQE